MLNAEKLLLHFFFNGIFNSFYCTSSFSFCCISYCRSSRINSCSYIRNGCVNSSFYSCSSTVNGSSSRFSSAVASCEHGSDSEDCKYFFHLIFF